MNIRNATVNGALQLVQGRLRDVVRIATIVVTVLEVTIAVIEKLELGQEEVAS